jgi:hypothetical protein
LAGALLKTGLAPHPKASADEPQQHPPIP